MTVADSDWLALAEWRRATAEMYTAVRHAADPQASWGRFVATRSKLFKSHPQSPLTDEQRAAFSGLAYYAYDPAFRVRGQLDGEVEASEVAIELGQDGLLRMRRVALVHFELSGQAAQLTLYWIAGYGGGLFLPFKDLTSRTMTFGGGRYLYDTIKGADLGAGMREINLDFNFAYNPSCAYHASWVCPLAPLENTLPLSVAVGEQRFDLRPMPRS